MNSKKIYFKKTTREKILLGINKVSNAVKITLGPKGKNVIIEKDFSNPLVTKDGITVAKSIKLKNRLENLGAQMLKEVASKTNDNAGDGTTTATVIAQTMINEGIKYISLGVSSIKIIKELNKVLKYSLLELTKMRKKISSDKEIIQVGTISSNNDTLIGKQIAKIIKFVGKEGVVTVEEGESTKDKIEVVKGMQFDRGFMSPYFINDNEKQRCVLENPLILLYEKKIVNIREILKILEIVSKKNKSILIISDNLDNEVLATLVINNIRGIIKVSAVKSPGFGEKKIDLLKDIAIITGGKIVKLEEGLTLKKIKIKDLGSCRKVEIYKEKTIIIGGKGDKKKIKERILQIKNEIKNSDSEYEISKLKERIAKLSGGIGVIKVGALTEIEMKEKKYRFEDALNATRAALESGIVPGGGIALFKVSEKIKFDNSNIGAKIMFKAIKSPMKQILKNAGIEPKIVVSRMREKKIYGFNLLNMKYCDMIEEGIIDPFKVVKSALKNAVSITKLVLNSECSICYRKKKKEMNISNPNI
ncbi:chaperonin GroEL [Candidatus Vidania fulgoroideae]|uniref:60 kDa chaperonin n=1 Tax=Candidatus Vidania fulgoroideorum TaxID=881286 RepID=A0AAX3NBQ8_9PROT|nr:chaperonin GroEL [Candidatus Vidania fulgoroideae]